MQIKIDVPIKADIINGGFEIKVSNNTEWSKSQLGDYAEKSGVYIHHSNGKILYIGKATSGKWGKYGERLRREFQEKASSNSTLFKLLKKQKSPIKSYLLDLDDIDMMINAGSKELSKERKALIMEQILIGIYNPEGNKT